MNKPPLEKMWKKKRNEIWKIFRDCLHFNKILLQNKLDDHTVLFCLEIVILTYIHSFYYVKSDCISDCVSNIFDNHDNMPVCYNGLVLNKVESCLSCSLAV